jgi:hypothetical protein
VKILHQESRTEIQCHKRSFHMFLSRNVHPDSSHFQIRSRELVLFLHSLSLPYTLKKQECRDSLRDSDSVPFTHYSVNLVESTQYLKDESERLRIFDRNDRRCDISDRVSIFEEYPRQQIPNDALEKMMITRFSPGENGSTFEYDGRFPMPRRFPPTDSLIVCS